MSADGRPQVPRIVVTGMGVVTPVGTGVDKFWNALVKGESGLNLVTKVNPDQYPTKVAAEVKDFNPEAFIPKKDIRRMDNFVQYAVAAAVQAVADAGLDFDKIDRERVGVVVGSGIGGLKTLEDQHRILMEKGPDRVSPFFIPMLISDMAAGMISIRFSVMGPNYATVSACASSAHALGESLKMLRQGEADLMIAGGAEATVCDLGMSGFCSMRAMSTRNNPIHEASCPFDKKRDGFVMGEGAGIVILETEAHAKARGAKIYAEFAGVGYSADAYHMTAPHERGQGALLAMKAALSRSGIAPEEVDYINAHGTSTPLGDKSETLAIKNLFGEHARRLRISSTKSMIGHLLGAAGAVEFITCALTLKHGVLTPTINLNDPDPECDLDYVPNRSVKAPVRVAISNSFGFGGHNVTIALRQYAA